MNQKFRRIVVWILLISLVLSLVPAVVLTAFAEDCAEGSHNFSAWNSVANNPAVCKERHCENADCSASETQEHDYTGMTAEPVAGGEKHAVKCKNCDYQKEENHNFVGAATVPKEGGEQHTTKCNGCDFQKEESHDYTDAVTAPIEGGEKHSVKCNDCEFLKEENHDYTDAAPTYVEGSEKHTVKCNDCTYQKEEAHVCNQKVIQAKYRVSDEAYYLSCVCGAAGETTFAVHTVVFDPDYEGAKAKATVVEANANVSEPEGITKTREGYRFDGWYKDAATKFEPGNKVTESFTVKAKWVKVYTVSFNKGSVTEVSSLPEPQSVDENAKAVKPAADPTTTEKKLFEEWAYSIPQWDFTVPVTQDVTVTAQWVDAYTVTVDSAITNGTVTVSSAKAKTGDEITVTVTPNDGYVLDTLTYTEAGSSIPVAIENNSFTVSEKDVTVHAAFKVAPFKLSVAHNDSLFYGSTVQLITDTKIAPTSWVSSNTAVATVDNSGEVKGKAVGSAVITATAGDQQATLTVNVYSAITVNNGGSSELNGCKGKVTMTPSAVKPGDTVTITVTPNSPYKLTSVQYIFDGKTKTIEAINGKYTFNMPNDATEVTVKVNYSIANTIKMGGLNDVIKSFSLSEHAKLMDAIVQNSASVSTDVKLTQAQKNALKESGDYCFALDVNKATDSDQKKKLDTATNISAIKQAVYNGDYKYMDISLWLQVYDTEGKPVGDPIQVTDTGSHCVTLTFDALRSPATRLYYAYDGKTAYYSQESGSTNGSVIYSKLHLFSDHAHKAYTTYELVYTTTSDNPKTADPFHLPIWMAMFVLSGIALPAVIFGGKKYLQ